MFVGVLFVTLGFNTLDQMIIRYKYYDYWRSVEYWEMSYFWKPHWWDMYIASTVMLTIGGVFLGIDTAYLIMTREKTDHLGNRALNS